MANKIEIVEDARPIDGYVSSTSRYADSTILRYGDANRLTFDIYKRNVPIRAATDTIAVIPPGMEYRPDLVSNKTYGTPDFWWRIMEVNNIFDIFDFKSGVTIRLPQDIF